jgi:tetraacyldisaccharide 4'-kinase
MKFKKPKFWDQKKPSTLSLLLLPFTILININNFFKDKWNNKLKKKNHSFKIKTICVGNIYLGGTGKTPSVIKINQILKLFKYNCVFIKKFYTNTLDESHLLKKNGPVIELKKRVSSLEKANKSYDLAIFDDGLQDGSVNYDLKFVCFNTKNFIGNGMLIPAGPLREKITSLIKYDAVFLNGNDEDSTETKIEIKKYNKDISIFETKYILTNLDSFNKKDKYVAFAGIGIPINFYKLLNNSGFNIINFLEYPDHYRYSYKDINKIKSIANDNGAKIITTEKDFSRIQLENNSSLIQNINYIEMELELKDENALINFLKEKI